MTARPISIWEPRTEGGATVWVRPEPGPFGDHYATRRELRPKRAELPLRVAFFGESVAAGYLYAPHLTPAGVLEAQLRAAGGDNNFEVIDLARTNETLAGLLATVRASFQINPDVLVLFAGNNWNLLETPEVSSYAPTAAARREMAGALQADGLAGPVRLARERLRTIAEAVFAEIALMARAVGIPVVVVVPEVNLADWENRQPVAWTSVGPARWHHLYKEAVAALERGDAEAAEKAARTMLEIDGGSCPTAWRLIARARVALGDEAGAAMAARAEVDAAAYPVLAFLGAPQAGTAVQDLLRELSRRHGFFRIDLPEIFAAYIADIGSPLPGRRLFLDYCHLTAEGMRVAMAAVTAVVLDLSGMLENPPEWRDLVAHGPAPTPEAEATACLGAAIHSAHRLLTVGSKVPLLRHWCAAALDASPGIAGTLLDLVEARSAPCPAVLTAAQQRNAASPYRLLLQHGWQWDHLDADVITAIRGILQSWGLEGEIDRRLLAFRSVPAAGIDLAAPPFFFLWEPLERFYPEVMRLDDLTAPAYLRCPWPETSFALLTAGDRDLTIELTARLPPSSETAERTREVRVSVNGQGIGSIPATARWSRSSLPIPKTALAHGLNRLTLLWPDLPPVDGDPLAAAIERLASGLAADLHPTFGEVFSLRVSPAAS
ncbi:MAG TPA: hypothetical protein VH988_13110 [Thermoanaerobaculia bacterium]|jgi:hypothetical protein|nr:hypothetical protein [Thermoanaerobaculia bacterium]